MADAIVHLTYPGRSGATEVAINIARGSGDPARHSFVFFGVEDVREDYVAALEQMGCQWRYQPKASGFFRGRAGYSAAAKTILAMSPAAVVLHGWRSLPASIRLRLARPGLPIVLVHHGPPADTARFTMRILIAAAGALASANVAVSASLAEQIRRKFLLRCCVKPLSIIPNGLDVSFWQDTPRTDAAGPRKRIGMIAGLNPTKDHVSLLLAVLELLDGGRDIELELIGDGPAAGELKDLAETLGIADRVTFLGDLDRESVRRHMGSWSAMVHSTFGEGFGLAVVEGMLAGVPVISTTGGGSAEIIEHGKTGLLVGLSDPAEIARAIATLLDDAALAGKLATEARQVAIQNYDATRMATDYQKLIDELFVAPPGEASDI